MVTLSRTFPLFLVSSFFIFIVIPFNVAYAGDLRLEQRVNEAFRTVFKRAPTAEENNYWRTRVQLGEKRTFESLLGAMGYQNSHAGTRSGKKAGVSPTNELIKNVLPLFIKEYGKDPSVIEKAWWRKRISCGEIKSQKSLVSSLRFHHSKKVRMGSSGICGGKTTISDSGVIRKQIAGISNHSYGDHVRIGIFHTDGRAIHVTSDKPYQVREGSTTVKASISAGDTIQVSWSDGKYHIRGSGVSLDSSSEIRLVPLEQGIMQLTGYEDKSQTIPGKNYNRFRGVIEIRKCDGCSELWAINDIRTEYYLRGLAESSDKGPDEYLKALGVAARTYVLYHKVVTGGRQPAKGYHIGRTADDQIYRGYEYEVITPHLASVFNSTRGIIVSDNASEALVSSVYFSDSDGRTRSAKEQWGTDRFPHLQHSVKDPHHISERCLGHCVGMSAQGAYGFAAKDGWNFQKILAYYFKGIKLIKAY